MKTITVTLFDSLGHIVTSYATKLEQDAYNYMLLSAEDSDRGLVVVKDCEVDGELGWKEYSL